MSSFHKETSPSSSTELKASPFSKSSNAQKKAISTVSANTRNCSHIKWSRRSSSRKRPKLKNLPKTKAKPSKSVNNYNKAPKKSCSCSWIKITSTVDSSATNALSSSGSTATHKICNSPSTSAPATQNYNSKKWQSSTIGSHNSTSTTNI